MQSDWVWGLVGGLLIGSAAALYLLGNGRIMGISGIVGGLVDGSARRHWTERFFFLGGVILMPVFLAILTPEKATTQITSNFFLIIAGGFLVGIGTRVGSGCTSGHGVCGISRFSLRGMVATCTFIGAGGATVLAMRLMGG